MLAERLKFVALASMTSIAELAAILAGAWCVLGHVRNKTETNQANHIAKLCQVAIERTHTHCPHHKPGRSSSAVVTKPSDTVNTFTAACYQSQRSRQLGSLAAACAFALHASQDSQQVVACLTGSAVQADVLQVAGNVLSCLAVQRRKAHALSPGKR